MKMTEKQKKILLIIPSLMLLSLIYVPYIDSGGSRTNVYYDFIFHDLTIDVFGIALGLTIFLLLSLEWLLYSVMKKRKVNVIISSILTVPLLLIVILILFAGNGGVTKFNHISTGYKGESLTRGHH
jgi:hypothetical protein